MQASLGLVDTNLPYLILPLRLGLFLNEDLMFHVGKIETAKLSNVAYVEH